MYDDDPVLPQDGNPGGSSDPTPQPDPAAPAGAASGGDPGREQADRERYIPRERFDEVNGQLGATRRQLAQLEQRFSSMGDMLAGRTPGQPADPRHEALRQQMFQLMPELKEFMDNREAILRAGNLAGTSEEHINAYWQNHGQTMASELKGAMAPVFGDKPSDETVGIVLNSFMGWLEQDAGRQQRYVRGDKALVGDFWQWYDGAVLQPARRTQNVSLLQRGQRLAQLPSRGPANQPINPERPKPKNADDLWDQAFDRFQQETARQ